jgi:anti-sigma-K factor RskA
MSQTSLHAYLLEDGPPVEASLLAGFLEEDVPESLAEATLNKVALLRTQPEEAVQNLSRWKSRTLWAQATTGLAIAAALLLAILPNSSTERQGDPDHMVAKGEKESAPRVSLKIAAIRDGVTRRHSTTNAYQPGDALVFRVQSDKAGFASLVHAENQQIEVLLVAPLLPGENDLGLPNGQHARWSFDESDADSLFAVISSTTPLDEDALQAGLADFLGENPLNKNNLCLAAQSIGCQCDAIEVMVLQ